MTGAETRSHTGEQELLAVVRALFHWRHYLEGAHSLTIVTDHRPNVTLNIKSPTHLSRRQVAWQQLLARFEFKWEWRRGAHNVADPLSRNPALLNTLSADDPPQTLSFLDKVQGGYDADPLFSDPAEKVKVQFDGSFWRRNRVL